MLDKARLGLFFWRTLLFSLLLCCTACAGRSHLPSSPTSAVIVAEIAAHSFDLFRRLDAEHAPVLDLSSPQKKVPPPRVDDRYGPGELGPRILLHTDEVSHIAPERLELNRIELPQELPEELSQISNGSLVLPPLRETESPFCLSPSIVDFLSGSAKRERKGRLIRVWEVRSARSSLTSPVQTAQWDAFDYLRTLGVQSIYDLSPLARKLFLPHRTRSGLAILQIPQTSSDPTAPTAGEWQSMIAEASRLFGLDSSFVSAMIQVESNFDHRAISRAGAVGAMQIMPKTQELLGLKDPFDARANIYAGCAYIRALLDKYQRVDLALAAYNAGPGAVDRYGGIPPYQETQNYVRNVLDLWQSGDTSLTLTKKRVPGSRKQARAHRKKARGGRKAP